MSASLLPARPESPARSLRGGDFRRITAGGARRSGPLFTVFVLPREGVGIRTGFTAGRRIGGAVVRNRARRVMREAWRSLAQGAADGFDVVFVAQPGVRGRGLADVRSEMARLLDAAGVLG
ncbi:MAG TPA: ribonuclease P protein component [Actinomycetota bacterium]|nr:ribonuclease P protein component [Actinomycetota bacterium]